MKKAHLVITVAATVVVAGAGGAFAASRLDSPNARSQAIISDAAGQLNIEPSKLTSALQKAIDNQIDAAVKAGKLSSDQGAALKKRVDSGQVPLIGGLGLGLDARGFVVVMGSSARTVASASARCSVRRLPPSRPISGSRRTSCARS